MKPMLAKDAQENEIRFPVIASPKLDGVRGLVIDGCLRSRSLKKFPNEHVQAMFSAAQLNGLDGELIMGEPNAKDVYRVTQSATSNVLGKPAVTFYVFDCFNCPGGYSERLKAIKHKAEWAQAVGINVVVLEQRVINTRQELLAYEQLCLGQGYEGLIIRAPNGPYKQGRSTVNEGWMLKLKRFTDSEAEIVGMEEEQLNGNAAKVNALGHTERSTAKAGLTGKGTMGALIVRDLKSGVQFNIGTGFTAADRQLFWDQRTKVMGLVVKYKSFLVGVKDAPRFPVYLGMRPKHDMS